MSAGEAVMVPGRHIRVDVVVFVVAVAFGGVPAVAAADGGTGSHHQELADPNSRDSDWLGDSVAISGETIVASAHLDKEPAFNAGRCMCSPGTQPPGCGPITRN